ncbi:hypothetical protein [uncultured Maribacter sp.]|uniref:hypothetical protein n=1 Tax=uncultured Maribacter sp. TaxID=431308 RepID=UPI0026051118|nr:hypothetical protein [uncultured Maribacter sp.]
MRILTLILLLTCFSCKQTEHSETKDSSEQIPNRIQAENNQAERIITEDYDVIFRYNNCSKKETTKDEAVIFFESDFNNDFVELYSNKNKIFGDTISTDLTLGLAKEIELGKLSETKEIEFRINNGRFISMKDINCNFMFVTYLKDSIVIVNFDKKFIGYN